MAEPTGPRVLIVDDDHTIARLLVHVVRSLGFGEATHVTTGRDGLEAMDQADIVLLDHQLPDANGLDILETVRARPNPPAVIVITAHGNESLAAAALRLGADDYLAKDQSLLEMLPQVLERVRRNRELRKALAAAEQDLVRAERLAAAGELTVTLHHNINNPLMSASADLELLLADPDMPVAQREQTLREIQTALRRIRDLVRQVGDLRDVRTKTYLPGVRMVDLDAASQPPPGRPVVSRGEALVLVAEEDLARVVDLLLRHAGFTVNRCGSVDALRQATGRLGVALVVVLGGTDAAGAHPLGGFDPPETRPWRLVALMAGDGTAARAAGADRVIELPFDPGSFTAEMIALVSGGW
jgi:DNA-binding response OmpR family regulator